MKAGKTFLSIMLLAVAAVFSLVSAATAAVTGDCVNCHTMHNSQDGQAMTFGMSNPDQPLGNLLKSDCVGCHSSSGSETIITIGNSQVPIVYNSTGTTKSLAGGNFYWVTQSSHGDNYGHNVFGIAGQDANHLQAPGANGIALASDCAGCHQTLASDQPTSGCRGCHLPLHHSSGNGTAIVDQEDGWYRFLGSAMFYDWKIRYQAYEHPELEQGVIGIEDADWEYSADATDHNVYQGTLWGYEKSYRPVNGSIGSFCSGCHGNFHKYDQDGTGAWIRHPSDVALDMLTAGSEYAEYSYTTLAPVAYEDVTDTTTTPLVTCLSCHRAHGSEYADMLRWDYGSCQTNTEDAACGCFSCHTAKDGAL